MVAFWLQVFRRESDSKFVLIAEATKTNLTNTIVEQLPPSVDETIAGSRYLEALNMKLSTEKSPFKELMMV
uniref:Ovule protein n=1 Tax=Panagrellus redivivus TaxID=6233 RepID=A0A7E4W6U1_PANRE